jgi:ADP-ribosyl-[dinitrogen reductase] hydrolase
MQPYDAIVGCILGTALGDAAGLPCEGLSPTRQRKLFGAAGEPTLFFGRRMVSDDTEHTIMTAQALVQSRGDVEKFTRCFAKNLRAWISCLPAGVGLATLKACLKLCVGVSPERSGVCSAGNGPAMRSALLGVCLGDDVETLRQFVSASSRLTHTDPRAEHGAFAVALAAHFASTRDDFSPIEYSNALRQALGADAEELCDLVDRAANSVQNAQTTRDFAIELGLKRGVSGYVLHTVPVVLHAWLCHRDDFHAAVMEIVRCGGDSDSTGAIVGALVGARVGEAGLPADWLQSLAEWPHNVSWMCQLGAALNQSLNDSTEVVNLDEPSAAISSPMSRTFIGAVLLRNLFFLFVVLCHGLRRLLPPY